MAPYISNTKQYITDNCDISHSSDNSSTVPLLRYITNFTFNYKLGYDLEFFNK